MLQRALSLFALLAAMLVAVADAQAERRVALIVGNAHYDHASTLRNPVNDAQDMGKVLEKLGFEVMLRTDLDQHAFARTIDEFGRMLNGADVALFFYAGHGLQANGKNYLVSTEAKLENEFLIPAETIKLDSIIQLMESRTKVNLIFLDACRNNPLADKLRRDLVAANRSFALGRGLARVEPTGRDTLIAFAAAPGQEAADGRGRNSPFTAALLQHVPEPGVEVSVMLKRVTAQVREETQNAQRPQQLSDMSRTFYFAKAGPAVAKAKAEPVARSKTAQAVPDYTVEVAYWNSARSANDCASVRAYLERFPSGLFVDLAELSEQRLCEPSRKVKVTAAPPQPQSPPDNSTPEARTAPPPPPSGASAEAANSPKPAAAEEAKSAAPAEAKTAALSPAERATTAAPKDEPESKPDRSDLARAIQAELNRVGCSAGRPDGIWGSRSAEALGEFSRRTGVRLNANAPSQRALSAVKRHRKRVCSTVAARPRPTGNIEPDSRKSRSRRQTDSPGGRSSGYAWCADMQAGRAMATNCGFTSRTQCEASISGMGGYCYRNPRQ